MDWTEHHLPIHVRPAIFPVSLPTILTRRMRFGRSMLIPRTRRGSAVPEARQELPIDRAVLVSALQDQYQHVPATAPVSANISAAGQRDNTFTVCTAHQPAIFTGHLYFIYKILHAIRLAAWLKAQYPEFDFVPVFYMGSEDADLDELGHIYLGGETLVWDTRQTGAVGRMKTKGLDKLLYRIEGELSVQPFGPSADHHAQRMLPRKPRYPNGHLSADPPALWRIWADRADRRPRRVQKG